MIRLIQTADGWYGQIEFDGEVQYTSPTYATEAEAVNDCELMM